MHPAAVPGPPFDFVQHDWPRLPSTTVSSVPTTPAPGAAMAVSDAAQENVLPVPLTTHEGAFALVVEKGV